MDSLTRVARDVVACERCPRLRDWCREVARVRVKRFRGEAYWGRPVPGFGDKQARLLVVGLAPAAHGGNRTGRVFTGDRSGDFLCDALFRAGFASSARSVSREDGLKLRDCYIAPLVRCAPPGNRPTPGEIAACQDYFVREWALLSRVTAVLALGQLAMTGFLAMLRGMEPDTPRHVFGHGLSYDVGGGRRLFTSYHPSQQNTFTGKLTRKSFDLVLAKINAFLKDPKAQLR